MSFILNGADYKINSYRFVSDLVNKAMFYLGSRKSGYIAMGINSLVDSLRKTITMEDINQYEEFSSGNFVRDPWDYIVNKYGGRFPIVVRSVPEGSYVDAGKPALTVEVLDKKCVWLGNYIEDLILNEIWYMSTVSTNLIKVMNFADQYGLKGVRFHYGKCSTCLEQVIKAALCVGLATGEFRQQTLLSQAYEHEQIKVSDTFYADHNVVLMNGEEGTIKLFDKGFIMLDTFDYKIVNKELITSLKDNQYVVSDAINPYVALTGISKTMYDTFGGELIDGKKYSGKPIVQASTITYDDFKMLVRKLSVSEWYLGSFVFSIGEDVFQNVSRDDHDFVYKCCAVDRGDGYIPVQKVSYNKVTFAGNPTLPELVFDAQTERKFTNKEIMENVNDAKRYVAT